MRVGRLLRGVGDPDNAYQPSDMVPVDVQPGVVGSDLGVAPVGLPRGTDSPRSHAWLGHDVGSSDGNLLLPPLRDAQLPVEAVETGLKSRRAGWNAG
jgi:hypothetical protein